MKGRAILPDTVSEILANGTITKDSDTYRVSLHNIEIRLRKYQCRIVLKTVVRETVKSA